MDAESRHLRAKAAANARLARTPGSEVIRPATEAWKQRFYDEVDPDRVLDPDERARRAHHAMRSHMARMSLAARKARKQRAEQRAKEKARRL